MNTMAAHPENQGKSYLQTILSYFLILALCCFYLLGFSPEKAFCYIYYIDHQIGDDGYNGQARSFLGGNIGPWKTLKNINEYPDRFWPGDKILLKRGLTWKLSDGTLNKAYTVNGANTALAIRCGGTSTNGVVSYITFGDYGPMSEEKPIINGDNIAANPSDCVVYINNDFIRLKNINITYIDMGYKDTYGNVTIYENGKGIRVDPSTNSNVQDTEANILIESCDVSNCPENGITIGPDRKDIVIDGYSNLPTLNAITPIIGFLLMQDDPPEEANLAAGGITSSTSTSSELTSAALVPPPLPSPRHHLPRHRSRSRHAPPLPPPPDLTVLAQLQNLIPSPATPPEFIPPPPISPSRPPVVPTIYPPSSFPPPDENVMAMLQSLSPTSLAPVEFPPVPQPSSTSSTAVSVFSLDAGDDPNIGYYSRIYGNGQSGISVYFNPSEYDPIYNPNLQPSHDIHINNCAIYDNNWHGIYLQGNYSIIENSYIYSNGRDPEIADPSNPDHNIYLWGNSAIVTDNTLNTASNGCGFRYSGSDLQFSNNKLKDNYRHAIGLWSNTLIDPSDLTKRCSNNTISNNTINMRNIPNNSVNYMAISMGSDPGYIRFSNTNITLNTIRGENDHTGGIDLHPCDNPIIQNNDFYCPSMPYHSGPQIQVNRDAEFNLTSSFSNLNTFYYISDPASLWFYDTLINDHPAEGWCSWGGWHLHYDLNSSIQLEDTL